MISIIDDPSTLSEGVLLHYRNLSFCDLRQYIHTAGLVPCDESMLLPRLSSWSRLLFTHFPWPRVCECI